MDYLEDDMEIRDSHIPTYTTPDPQILLPQFTVSVIASFKKLSSTAILLDNHL